MLNMENISSNNTDEDYERIDSLLESFPGELQSFWENKIDSLSPEEAVRVLEGGLALRSQVASHGSVHFSEDVEHDPILMEGCRRTIAGLESSHGRSELFLGDGMVAEVYRVASEPRICIKSVVNEEAYKNGNTIYQEGNFLEQLNHLEVDGVRTPKFYFYHDSLNLRSLGMETIEGASLSKIIGRQLQFSGIEDISVDDFYRSLVHYVEAMHDLKIFHGDLFERNIMLDKETLKPRIIDFGKSKQEYFEQDIRGYREGDFEVLKRARHSLESFLKGETVDLR